METVTFEQNLLKLIRICYKTYQVPFAWNAKKKRFFVDNSFQFKIFSFSVLLLDIFCIFLCLISAIRNSLAGFSYTFTLVLLFLLFAAIENVVIDVNFIVTKTVTLQLLNALHKFVNFTQGTNVIWAANETNNLIFISDSYYHIPPAKTGELNLILVSLYRTSGIVVCGIALTLPFTMFSHSLRLYSKLFQDLTTVTGVSLPDQFSLMTALASYLLFLVALYITAYKWLFVVYLCIIYENLSCFWISACGKSTTMYRGIYILVNLYNEFVNVPIITIQFTITVMISLGFAFSLLDGVSLVSLAICIMSVGFIVVLNYILAVAKTLSELSEKLLYNWKLKEHEISLLQKKTVMSLRPCRIYCGSRYFIDAGVICHTNNTIPNTTASNVLMLKELRHTWNWTQTLSQT